MKLRALWKNGAALVAVAFLVACAPAQTPSSTNTGSAAPNTEKRAAKQMLRYSQPALPANLAVETSEVWRELYLTIYDPVVMMNGDHEIQPWAATKWELVNPNTWRITLRKDLTFSNGDKLTAADVAFTGQFVLDNHTPPISQLGTLSEVKMVDDYTVDFISKTNDVSTIAGLAYLSIMPKNYFNSVGRQGFLQKPIGSGPYVLADFKPSDTFHFTLRSDKHPFRSPTLTDITVSAIPEKSAALAGLRTGDLDFVQSGFTGEDLDSLAKDGYTINARLTGNSFVLIPQSETESRKLPTTDVRVRQAMNYAIDKQALSKTFYHGEAQPAGQLGPVGSPFMDPSIQPYPYDPAKAKQLLAQAGYPNGFTLPNGFDYNRSNTLADIWVAIQSNLKDVGINVELNGLEYGIYTDEFRNLKPKGDLYASGLYDTNGFNATIRTYFGCNAPYKNDEGRVWWCSQQFDSLNAQAATEPDLTKRAALLHQAAKVVSDDVRVIFLLQTPQRIVQAKTVKGFNWNEDRLWTFDSIYRVE